MSVQFKSVEPRLAPPSRGQHLGAVVLDVLHRGNRVIIRSMRPPGQAGASPAELAPRKHKSAARRVGRAALAPHRAPGAQAVRVICFSCGRTRPATICQAPVASRREAGRGKPCRGTSSSSSSWIRRAPHAARAATAQPAQPDRARIAHAAHICSVQVLLARMHKCQHARRRAAGHVRRVGDAPQSFVRVSVALRVSCTSRC